MNGKVKIRKYTISPYWRGFEYFPVQNGGIFFAGSAYDLYCTAMLKKSQGTGMLF